MIGLGEGRHRAAGAIPDLLQARRGGNGEPTVAQELHDLPADLELPKIAMEIDPVQTLQVQLHMPLEHVVDRHRVNPCQTGCHDNLRNHTYGYEDAPTCTEPPEKPSTSAVSGEACLG